MNNIEELSFASARKYFKDALNRLMQEGKFSQTKLCLAINEISSSLVSTTDVKNWLSGDKIPNVYQLYKLSKVFDTEMDSFFSEQLKKAQTVSVTSSINTSINNTISKKDTTMKSSNNTVTISRKSKTTMDRIVRERTASRNYNPLLASRIYSSSVTLKTIAEKAGVSTRSLRDYAFYGTTVPAEVANALTKFFKTNYRNLGLTLNEDSGRYDHMTVKIAK